jgi:hypothetical protein
MRSKLRCFAVAVAAVVGLSAPMSGQTLFAATGSNGVQGILYTINPANANVVLTIGPIKVGASPIGITGLAFHPTNGTLYGVTANESPNFAQSLVTINPATGAATLIGSSFSLTAPVPDISFDNTGVLYGFRSGGDANSAQLGTINLSNGTFSGFGPTGGGQGSGIAFNPNSPFTLFASLNGSSGPLLTVDKTTGARTTGPTLSGAPYPNKSINAMAVNNAGVLFASNSDKLGPAHVNLVTINTSTGAVTNVGALPNDTDAIAFQIVTQGPPPPGTPIPTTVLLMASGLVCLGIYAYRRKLIAN